MNKQLKIRSKNESKEKIKTLWDKIEEGMSRRIQRDEQDEIIIMIRTLQVDIMLLKTYSRLDQAKRVEVL